MNIIITAPSLDPTKNVSGVSSVAQFIIQNNSEDRYLHFLLGKSDEERGWLNRLRRTWKAYREWKTFLGREEEALIHYSFPLSAPSILRDPIFMSFARRRGRKMVVHIHGGLFLTARKIPFILERIMRWVFSWDMTFIVLSEGERRILEERFGAKKVVVLPNCPDIPVSPRVGIDAGHILTLGYLGRIEPNKGMKELLDACIEMKRRGMRFKLRFAGKEQRKDEFLPDYEARLGECFEYVGLVSGESKDAFLRSLDVFVMPTYFEGLPMSLLECMGYGVVPVVTPVGSIPDVVKPCEICGERDIEDANGVFVDVRSAEGIVCAVAWLDKHRQALASLGMNARRTIVQRFSPEAYVEKLREVYGMTE